MFIQLRLAVVGNSTFILCDLGNPYVTGSEDVIDIILDVSSIPVDTKEVRKNACFIHTYSA